MTGMEFLEPRMGFFCQVCAKFYCEDEEAKESHCRSVKHYENLEVGYGYGYCQGQTLCHIQ